MTREFWFPPPPHCLGQTTKPGKGTVAHLLTQCAQALTQLQSWSPNAFDRVPYLEIHCGRLIADSFAPPQVAGVGIVLATLYKDLSPTPEGLRNTFSLVATVLSVAYYESNMALPHVIEERVIVGKETFQKLYR